MNKKVTYEGMFQCFCRRARPEFSKNTQEWAVFFTKCGGERANGRRRALAEDC